MKDLDLADSLSLDPSSATYWEAFGLDCFNCKMGIIILPT